MTPERVRLPEMHKLVDLDRPSEAFDANVPDQVRFDVLLECSVCALAEEDLAAYSFVAEAGGQARDGAECSVVVSPLEPIRPIVA
jgi:hypothetical protein